MATRNSNQNNNQNEPRKIKGLASIFITFAGSGKEILRQCSRSEITKHASIGATIFATALLACLSGGYAIYTIFRNTNLNTADWDAYKIAIPIGLFWGFFVIFNLDRFIVSSFRKSGNFWRELLQAIPRIILAVIIAFVISKPLEIKIFESRLAEQIQINKQNSEKMNADHYAEINKLSEKKGKITSLDTVINNLTVERDNLPQWIIDKQTNQLEPAKSSWDNIEKQNRPKINELARERDNLINNARFSIFNEETGKRELTADGIAERSRIESRIRNFATPITRAKTNYENIDKEIKGDKKAHKDEKQEQIDNKKGEKQNAHTALTDATEKAAKETATADTTSAKAFSNNFVTQLEALGDLTDYKKYELLKAKYEQMPDSIAHLDGFNSFENNQNISKAKTMNAASWAIFFLLLAIELSPILTKLIVKRGNYDVLLDMEEDKINFIAHHENIANKFLVKEFSMAQRDVLNHAIEQWKDQEIENENLANNYINNNSQENEE
jgi:hypothetical protein